jgi:hypothetical protein
MSSGTTYNICNNEACPNLPETVNDLQRKLCPICNQSMDQFFTCSVQTQLIEILSKPHLLHQIMDSNNWARTEHTGLYDVIDGIVYKEAIQSISTEKLCVSLIVNTDGAPITSSTNYSLWPMLATIVELEPASRGSFKNMVFLGFWLGNNKPNYQLYTKSCLKELRESKSPFHVKSELAFLCFF